MGSSPVDRTKSSSYGLFTAIAYRMIDQTGR